MKMNISFDDKTKDALLKKLNNNDNKVIRLMIKGFG